MKILKAKTSHTNKKTMLFDISELTYIKSMPPLKDILRGEEMMYPIEVIKHNINKTPRLGSNGASYVEKKFSLHKGSQRIQAAIQLGYTHIEGIIINE
jgi:hypothetical protein